VRLLGSAEISTPMTWGSLRPVILLPSRSRRWSEERRRIVLLHELVHIRRADWLVRLVARLVCSIYWLNPLVWVAARRLAVEQEIACDEEVVALGTRPSSYASHLLAIARTLGPAAPTPAHALDMARRSQMEGRLMSILDENRRLRSGRKLAVMALVVIAGLVPALAAIEPWSDEEASRSTSGAADPIRASVEADTEGLARALAELESLERQMAPFEAELEGLEAELEPIVSELEGIEIEMEPHQARLEAIEGELEPFEELLATIEREMEPLEDRLQAIESELEPFEDRLEAIESELEPLQDEMEALSDETEPLTREGAVDAVELERLSTLMQTVHQRMAPLMERIGATHEEMEPLYERMAEVHRELAPLHERMGSIHEQMRPVIDKMAAVHQELEPLHERLSGIHQQMEPVHDRMSAAHDRMAPIHERMGEHHRRMEPYHHKMGEIHERMRPLHEQMRLRHLELEEELVELVERMLVAELSGLTSAGTGCSAAATEIANAVSLRVDDGKLTIMSSAPRLREILGATLGGRSTVSEQEFAAAVERFVRALNDLEVEAP
jgi:predicted  nucleic acid-binding Zn-ribbon protein